MQKIQSGQTLFYVSRHGGTKEVAVTKVGSKWLYLSNGEKINPNTFEADGCGYVSPGKCYLTEQDYLENIETKKIYKELADYFSRFTPPENLTLEKARKILEIIKTN